MSSASLIDGAKHEVFSPMVDQYIIQLTEKYSSYKLIKSSLRMKHPEIERERERETLKASRRASSGEVTTAGYSKLE
jgi:hypothetical protein